MERAFGTTEIAVGNGAVELLASVMIHTRTEFSDGQHRDAGALLIQRDLEVLRLVARVVTLLMVLKYVLVLRQFGLHRLAFIGSGVSGVLGFGQPPQLHHGRHQQQTRLVGVQVAAGDT